MQQRLKLAIFARLKAKCALKDVEPSGIGENAAYQDRKTTPIPADGKIRLALAGNQNCGKTTLFNQLTGSNQRVGNFPGVTIDQTDGVIKKHSNVIITDCREFIPFPLTAGKKSLQS